MAAACREHILINFSQDLQAHRFYELYKNLLSDSIVSNTKEGCSPYGMLSPRLDFGPQTRLIFPKLVRSVIPSLELESINDCSAESRFLKFYRALESKLACQLSYEVFLKTLEDAWNESPKPISTENTLPSKESHPLSFFIKFFMKRFQ
jgi:hypothetical protein